MNARGAMEIILGILALQAGLIRDNMFVAMVTMALFTSLLSAPAIHFLVGRTTHTHSEGHGNAPNCSCPT